MNLIKSLLISTILVSIGACSQNQDTVEERQWPSYRGYYASGILDNTSLPEHWDEEEGEKSNKFVQWSIPRGGSYMHSMLLYNDYLYNVGWNGIMECFDPESGERIYREKLGGADTFIASPVASDGKIFIVSDHGDVYTIKAGAEFEILAENHLNDICMVVPAITDNTIYFRTQHSLIAVSDSSISASK